MNRHLLLLALCQGLFLTNNVVFIAINGLVGLSLAPQSWMPFTGYVVGGALSAALVAYTQRLGEQAVLSVRSRGAALSASLWPMPRSRRTSGCWWQPP